VARTLVKVCGITRLEDARVAVEAGADWLGCIVEGESSRRIEPERAAEIAAAFPGTPLVAVMVSPSPARALELARRARAQRVQLHRVAAASWPDDFALPVTFAMPVPAGGVAGGALPDPRHLLLLDSDDAIRAGGTGRAFEWAHAVAIARTRAVLVAGGLDDANVVVAIETIRPFGVDASSRLEREPGRKDPDKVRRFVAAVRACDERLGSLA
jgi:phosphoribosylanthranilate isomerase